MSGLPDRLDPLAVSTLAHPCSQIRVGQSGWLKIPRKYEELFPDEDDLQRLHVSDWPRLQALYVSSYWLSNWYTPELPTPSTEFVDSLASHWRPGLFIRLDALSSKSKQPYPSCEAAMTDLNTSERCQAARALSARAGIPPPCIALRQWVELAGGKEYRCVIFEGKLAAIVSDQLNRVDFLTVPELEARCQRLLERVQYNWPCVDNVMDVWLAEEGADSDLVIEFNSFGVIGHSHSDYIDWTDVTLYLGGACQFKL